MVRNVDLTEADIDGLGHLNQARYHGLLGLVRGQLLMEGFDDGLDHGFVVARSELDYHREVRLEEGHVTVRAEIEAVGTKSVTIYNELVRADGTVAASGRATMVAWDAAARHSRPVSERERAAFEADPS